MSRSISVCFDLFSNNLVTGAVIAHPIVCYFVSGERLEYYDGYTKFPSYLIYEELGLSTLYVCAPRTRRCSQRLHEPFFSSRGRS